MSYKTAIHNALTTTAQGGQYAEAVYSIDRPSLLSLGDPVVPASVETNEVRGRFGLDDRYGREYRQERQGWAWLLIIRFDTEAVLEDFETFLMQNPITIPRDTADGVDVQVRLLLEDSAYEHPPRGGASNGTQVTYRFVAELCPQ